MFGCNKCVGSSTLVYACSQCLPFYNHLIKPYCFVDPLHLRKSREKQEKLDDMNLVEREKYK